MKRPDGKAARAQAKSAVVVIVVDKNSDKTSRSGPLKLPHMSIRKIADFRARKLAYPYPNIADLRQKCGEPCPDIADLGPQLEADFF
jgi:hypothetical protein